MSNAITTINIPTGLSRFGLSGEEPSSGDEQYLHCHARADLPGQDGSVSTCSLYKAELKLVEQMAADFTKYATQLSIENAVIDISKGKFLVALDKADPGNVEAAKGAQYSAVITTYEGHGMPPARATADWAALGYVTVRKQNGWKKMWHEKSLRRATCGLQYRWTKVDLFNYDDAFLDSNLLDGVSDTLNHSGGLPGRHFTVIHVKVSIVSFPATLKQLVQQVQDEREPKAVVLATDAINALLKHYDSRKDDSVVVHGNKIYEVASATGGLEALRPVQGTLRTLHLNANEEPVLRESFCNKLLLPSISVAEFITGYMGSPPATSSYYETLRSTLRGRFVKFRTSFGWEKRAVSDISSETALTTPNHSKHRAWHNRKDPRLQYPDLPCLNVGTLYTQALMPAELCIIEPMQTLTGPYSSSIQRSLEPLQSGNAGAGARVTDKAFVRIAERRRSVSKLNEELRRGFNKGIKFFFAQAGVVELASNAWDFIRKQLVENEILDESCINCSSPREKPLFLGFRSGSDFLGTWTVQLKRYLATDESEIGEAVLIVLVRDDEHNQHIYRSLKSICDTSVGVQAYFVNTGRLSRNMRKFGTEGPKKSANELVRRMRMRILPQSDSKRSENIAIALHIASTTVNDSQFGDDGTGVSSKTVFQVVLTSRSFESSRQYQTKVRLLGPKEVTMYDPSRDVAEFVSALLPPISEVRGAHHITILRTGYLPTAANKATTESRGARKGGVSETTKLHDGVFGGMYRSDAVKNEHLLLREAIRKKTVPPAKVSYILLSEERNVCLGEAAKAQIDESTKRLVPDGGNATGRATFFVTDTAYLHSNSHSVAAHRNVSMQNNNKLISLELLGDPLVELESRPNHVTSVQASPLQTLKQGQSPRTRSAPSTPDMIVHQSTFRRKSSEIARVSSRGSKDNIIVHDENASPTQALAYRLASGLGVRMSGDHGQENVPPGITKTSRVTQASDPYASQHAMKQPKAPANTISDSELQRLAMLWHDDKLELYDTKWPIPTHLAHLAAKRALLHMKADRWDDADDTAPFRLPPVAENVAKTLYFL